MALLKIFGLWGNLADLLMTSPNVINRPGVAGAVLQQTALVRVLCICLLRHLLDYFDSSWGDVRSILVH